MYTKALIHLPTIYIVAGRGVVQLGGPDFGFARGVPTFMSILFTERSCVVEVKNTWLI